MTTQRKMGLLQAAMYFRRHAEPFVVGTRESDVVRCRECGLVSRGTVKEHRANCRYALAVRVIKQAREEQTRKEQKP